MPLKPGRFVLLCSTIAVELGFPWCRSTSLNFPPVQSRSLNDATLLHKWGISGYARVWGEIWALSCARTATDGEEDLVRGCRMSLYMYFPF